MLNLATTNCKNTVHHMLIKFFLEFCNPKLEEYMLCRNNYSIQGVPILNKRRIWDSKNKIQ